MCNGVTDHFYNAMLDPQVWEALHEIGEDSASAVVKDVHGGLKYKELKRFTSLKNLTLTVNTDGVQLFKSSTVSMWPIWILINELPVIMR